MKIRAKLLTSLLLLLCILGSGIGLIEHCVVIPKVESLEINSLNADLKRVEEALQRELEHISQLAIDWGHWDETYTYVQHPNPDFVSASLASDTLAQLSVDVLLISRGERSLFLQTSDRLAGMREPVRAKLLQGPTPRLLAQGGRGLIAVNGRILLVSASPVLRTNGQGPVLGTLYFGRLVDASLVQALEQVLSLDVSLALAHRTAGPSQIEFPSGNASISQIWLPMIGDPSRSVRIELHETRPFLNQTLVSTYYIMGTIFILGLLGALATYLLLQHYLIAPILNLQRAVEHFSHSHSLDAFNIRPRGDELGTLTQAFRDMAARLSMDREMILNEREQLKHDSLTDPLTGLGNRRFLRYSIEHERRWAADHYLVILSADIDHFKMINDIHGHDVGDQALREFAQLLKTCCREEDFLVRSGGEEFLAICELATVDDAAVIAERIRAQTEQRLFANGHVEMTCSIGFIVTPAAELNQLNNTWDRLFKVADMALYRAKEEGRNRWIGWRHSYLSQVARQPLPLTPEELDRALTQHILAPIDR